MLLAGVTANPTEGWVAQQAHGLLMEMGEQVDRFQLLIRDRDAKFTAAFDHVFTADRIRVVRTPVRASPLLARTDPVGPIERIDRLGGLIHEYRHTA